MVVLIFRIISFLLSLPRYLLFPPNKPYLTIKPTPTSEEDDLDYDNFIFPFFCFVKDFFPFSLSNILIVL